MNKKDKNITYIIGAIVLIGIVLLSIKRCNKRSSEVEQINLVSALQDSLRFYKKQDSVKTATIEVITTESTQNFTGLKVKDGEIVKLQALVKEYQGKLKAGSSVTTGLVETVIKQKTPTVIVIDTSDGDIVWDHNDTPWTIENKPNIYTASDSTKWLQYTIIATPDTTSFDLKVHNEFTAAIGIDPKTKKPFVDLTLKNPYSEVTSLRTYQVSIPKDKKRWGIGIQGGGTYILDKIRPYVGVGLSYNLIRF